MENKKIDGWLYRGKTVSASWEIAIGTEDCRLYPYELEKAKRMAAKDHGLQSKDVNWHLMKFF